ncbi:MAG: hypothetical protein HW374_559 [Bacteroidetes bacterium]|nr:hypothetical protein [Bacteroidota bacterium]
MSRIFTLFMVSAVLEACSPKTSPDTTGPIDDSKPTLPVGPIRATSFDSLRLTLLKVEVGENRMPIIIHPGDSLAQFDGRWCTVRYIAGNESSTLYFDSLWADSAHVILNRTQQTIGTAIFYREGSGRLVPNDRDTVTLYRRRGTPYFYAVTTLTGTDSVKALVFFSDSLGHKTTLQTPFVKYLIVY